MKIAKIILSAIKAFKGRIQRQGNKSVMQALTAETSDSTILLWQKKSSNKRTVFI